MALLSVKNLCAYYQTELYGISRTVRAVDGRAQDVSTGADGEVLAVDSVRLTARVDASTYGLLELSADPPEWWRKAHAGEVMTWEDGSHQYHGVVASPLYRRDAAARVAALVEHLE